MSVDARRLYEMSSGNISSLHFTKLITEEMNKFSKLEKFVDFLKKIRGVTIFGNAIEIEAKKFELSDMFEKLNSFAQHSTNHFVVFIDEAQYLRFYGSRGGEELLASLAYCYDDLNRVRFILTGSEVGVLQDFLKLDDPNSFLYGRAMGFLTIKSFTFERSIEFLKRGFEEFGEKVDIDLAQIVEQIDGVPGYLVLFGMKYISTKNRDEALQEVFPIMQSMLEKELSELSKRSPRYMKILKAIANGANSWSSLKNILHAEGDFISDSRMYEALEKLQKMSLIEKTSDGYKISDKLLEKLLRENRL